MSSRTQILEMSSLAATVVCMVASQLLIKSGTMDVVAKDGGSLILGLSTNAKIVSGLFMAAVAAAAWIFTLTRFPLSFAYPFVALTLPAVVLLSGMVFGEEISRSAYIGTIVILAGLILCAR